MAASLCIETACPWSCGTLRYSFCFAPARRSRVPCFSLSPWRRSQVVRQRSAKPPSRVRISAAPLTERTRSNLTGSDEPPSFTGSNPSPPVVHPNSLSRQNPTVHGPRALPVALPARVSLTSRPPPTWPPWWMHGPPCPRRSRPTYWQWSRRPPGARPDCRPTAGEFPAPMVTGSYGI